MLQTKKLNASMIATVVLSVLLAVVITFAGTNAWFATSDAATGNLGLTGDVTVNLSNESKKDGDTLSIEDITLVPGHPLLFNLDASVGQTNTPYLVRARFVLEYNGVAPVQPTDTEDPDYAEDLAKYNAYVAAELEFLEFLKFDAGVVTIVDSIEYAWSAMQIDESEADRHGWYYLHADVVDSEDFIVGAIHSGEDSEMTRPTDIEAMTLAIANGYRQVPQEWNNDYAYLNFSVTLEIEATQAEVYETIVDTATLPILMPTATIDDMVAIFEYVFEY